MESNIESRLVAARRPLGQVGGQVRRSHASRRCDGSDSSDTRSCSYTRIRKQLRSDVIFHLLHVGEHCLSAFSLSHGTYRTVRALSKYSTWYRICILHHMNNKAWFWCPLKLVLITCKKWFRTQEMGMIFFIFFLLTSPFWLIPSPPDMCGQLTKIISERTDTVWGIMYWQ